ncbi:MAG TPA: MarR family transcriptional regulator [Humisphaera sp.]
MNARTKSQAAPAAAVAPAQPTWTFLSNHAHVLLLIAGDPASKLRDVAMRVGITERAVQRIVADLEAANYLERERVGRRNHYRVHPELPLRHPIEARTEVGALLDLILKTNPVGEKATPARRGGKA